MRQFLALGLGLLCAGAATAMVHVAFEPSRAQLGWTQPVTLIEKAPEAAAPPEGGLPTPPGIAAPRPVTRVASVQSASAFPATVRLALPAHARVEHVQAAVVTLDGRAQVLIVNGQVVQATGEPVPLAPGAAAPAVTVVTAQGSTPVTLPLLLVHQPVGVPGAKLEAPWTVKVT